MDNKRKFIIQTRNELMASQAACAVYTPLVPGLMSDENMIPALNEALQWCRHQRKDWPPHDAVWALSLNWTIERTHILHDLTCGNYCFEPVKVIKQESGRTAWVWHARDAIVLKAMTHVLQSRIQGSLSPHCTHPKGHGTIPRAIESVETFSQQHSFVFKSDVKGFYESINHDILLQ